MKHFSQISFSLLLACHASLCLAASSRVALMPSGDAKATAIVDLMEVELAGREDLVLLDRSNVGRILGEQKLVLEGLLSADDAFAIGQLLGCDVFGELFFKVGSEGTSSVCVLKAFDAVTGVRLCDLTLDVSSALDQMATDASRSLSAALLKRGGDEAEGKVRAVTLVSVRNVDLPSDQDHLADAVGPILERKLLGSSGITLLERQRLDLVNEEAVLTEDLREQLLSSSVLLDLDLSRGNEAGEIRIRATVSNSGGKEIAVAVAEHAAMDIVGLVDAFVRELLAVLELPAVKTIEGSNQREADRFANECRRLLAKNQLREALTAIECAHALHPTDIEIQAMLCDILERVSQEYVQEAALETALQILERTWFFRQQWQASGHSRRTPYPQMSLECLLAQKQKLSTGQQERFARIRRLFRERWLSDPYRRLDYVNLWAETPDEWMDTLLAYGKGYPEEFSTPRFEHLVLGLSSDKKRELLGVNEQRAHDGDPRGFVECVILTHHMRDVMPDAEQKINNYLTQFVDEAIEDKESDGPLLFASTQMFGLAIRLTPSVIRPFVHQLKRETERRKLVNPKIVKFEGTRGFGGSPVAYKKAAQQLLAGYVPITNRYVNAKFGFDYPAGFHDNADLLLAWCKQKYKIATKQELVLEGMPSGYTIYWADQKKIFEIPAANQHASIFGVVQREDSVFIAVNQSDETPQTTLIEFNLVAGTQRKVSTIEGRIYPYYLWSAAPWSDSNLSHSRMSAGNRAVYLPGTNGLAIFPRNGETPRFLRSGEDLPDAAVVAVIEIGNALYVACERMIFKDNMKQSVLGMLLKTDLYGNNQVVLASSERKEAHSPLDNTDPYFIEGFLYDEAGDLLYFMIGRNGGSNQQKGMWQLNLKSGVFTHVEKRHISLLKEFAPQADGTIWFECANSMYAWDPHKEKIRPVMDSYPLNTIPRARCAAILNDVLYVRSVKPVWDLGREGLIRVAMKSANGTTDSQPMSLEPFLAHPPIFVNAWQGKLVAADWRRLWLLTPPEKNGDNDWIEAEHLR